MVAGKAKRKSSAHRPRVIGEGPRPEPPRVGRRLKALRQHQRLSLEALSRRAGVSKSMLSQIERNKANPTVAVVWRLAAALRVTLTEILGTGEPEVAAIRVSAGYATPTLSSPDGRCELRILGPVELAGRHEWYELVMQGGGVLASEAHAAHAREHLTVLEGTLEIKSGTHNVGVKAGDTARYGADVPHSIRNTGTGIARALLVVLEG